MHRLFIFGLTLCTNYFIGVIIYKDVLTSNIDCSIAAFMHSSWFIYSIIINYFYLEHFRLPSYSIKLKGENNYEKHRYCKKA